MTRKQWDEMAAEITQHLEAIRRIAKDHTADICLYVYSETARAFHIDDDSDVHYGIERTQGEYFTSEGYRYQHIINSPNVDALGHDTIAACKSGGAWAGTWRKGDKTK